MTDAKKTQYIVTKTFHMGDSTKVKLSDKPQSLTAKQIEVGTKAKAIQEV